MGDQFLIRGPIDSEQVRQDLDYLVTAAYYGSWSDIKNKLQDTSSRYPFLVNAIPDSHPWGILHQAAWWGNEDIVQFLLFDPLMSDVIDPTIMTKEETNDQFGTYPLGSTPYQIAEIRSKKEPAKTEYKEIMEKLKAKARRLPFKKHAPSLVPQSVYKDKPIENLLLENVSENVRTFLKSTLPKKRYAPDLHNLMEEIYQNEDWQEVWELVRTGLKFERTRKELDPSLNILGSLGKPPWFEFIQTDSGQPPPKSPKSKEEMDKVVIELYTSDAIWNYAYFVLRDQLKPNYKPSAFDLDLAPYLLQLDVAVFNLKPDRTQFTYSGVSTSDNVNIAKYTKGLTFAWPAFASSSRNIEIAERFADTSENGVVFKIDNGKGSDISLPRDISGISVYPEEESLYHAATAFKVTSDIYREGGYQRIDLELQNFSEVAGN